MLQSLPMSGQEIESYLAATGLQAVRIGPGEWHVILPGEERDVGVSILLDEKTLYLSSFFMRGPDNNREQVYRLLLLKNTRLYGMRFSLNEKGDIFLTGRVSTSCLDAEELDRLLGCLVQYTAESYKTIFHVAWEVGADGDRHSLRSYKLHDDWGYSPGNGPAAGGAI